MTVTASKPELYELVQALHRNGASTYQIAEAFACSAQTIRNVLIALGIERRRSLSEILQSLDADMLRRVEILQTQRRQQQQTAQAA